MLDTISIDRRRALKTLFCSSAAMMLQLRDREARADIVQKAAHVLMIGDFGTGGKLPSKWYRFEIGAPNPMVTVMAIDTNFPAVSGGKQKSESGPRHV